MNTDMRIKSKNGFTLIEVLVALALFALLVGLIQGVYSGVLKGQKHIDSATKRSHMAAFVLDRIVLELGAAFVSADRMEETPFTLKADGQDNSELSFTTRLPGMEIVEPKGETTVKYLVDKGDEDVLILRRGETQQDGDQDIEFYELMSDIAWFKVKCFDPDLVDGTEAWDSMDRINAPPPYVPQWVSVEIAWGEKGKETVMRTTTPLYNRQ